MWWACYIYVLKIDKEYINYPIFISCYFLVLLKSLTLFSLCSQTTLICSPCSLQSALFNFFIGKIFYKVTSCRFGFSSFVILFFEAAQEVGIRRWLLTRYIETISVVLVPIRYPLEIQNKSRSGSELNRRGCSGRLSSGSLMECTVTKTEVFFNVTGKLTVWWSHIKNKYSKLSLSFSIKKTRISFVW